MDWFNRDFIENFIRLHKKSIIKAVAGFTLFAIAFAVFCIRDFNGEYEEFNLVSNESAFNEDIKTIDYSEKNLEADTDSQGEIQKDETGAPTEKKMIYVDVSGSVEKPYVYEMPEGSRVYEAVAMAGGFKDDADTDGLNLAQVLIDEDKITVPSKSEVKKEAGGAVKQNYVENKGSQNVTNIRNEKNNENNSSELININTATSAQLQSITGIGPSTAEKIISYRQEHGNFNKIEDLMKVSGIGQKTFTKFKNKITV